MDKLQYDGPVVLAVLDGVGLAPESPRNAVSKAWTPFLGRISREYLHLPLEASGEAVGLLFGQMGNSEVGHNTMGAGKAYRQGVAQIEDAFSSGEVFLSEAWKGAMAQVLDETKFMLDKSNVLWYNEKIGPATLHFAGIFSDGGVHSHIIYLEKMILQAYKAGVRRMRLHAMFDGRDVPPQSEPKFIRRFEEFAKQFPDADIRIASGGGRQTTVSDRYENDWGMVERGWKMMVLGEADYRFRSAEEGILSFRAKDPTIQDQDLPAFVIVDETGEPVGKIQKGDALIYFDFRKDRAIEIAEAFVEPDFSHFDRGDYTPRDVFFVGMTEYNSDTHLPQNQLVPPVKIERTLHEFLGERRVSQFAISETLKFGHITYYFNGNSYEKAPLEEFLEIESFKDYPANRPWMKSAEITDEAIRNLGRYRFIRLNYPNGDIVGHTADMEATVIAIEAVDLCLKRLAEEVDKVGGVLVIIADHGNAEELFDEAGEKKTAHTTNKVPCVIYDNTKNREKYRLAGVKDPGLKNIAATMAVLLGQDGYPESWEQPLISVL